MLPVPSLEDARVWIELDRGRYVLFGFFLYYDADAVLVAYMQSALVELDHLSGADFAIFVIESPSHKWREYVRRKDHPWSRLWADILQRRASTSHSQDHDDLRDTLIAEIVENQADVLIQLPDGTEYPLGQLLET